MQIATGNGENKSLSLPDGSEVLLAPNSSISYPKDFIENDTREIWAKGDVKLNVKHLNQNPGFVRKGERFIVHLDQEVKSRSTGHHIQREQPGRKVAGGTPLRLGKGEAKRKTHFIQSLKK